MNLPYMSVRPILFEKTIAFELNIAGNRIHDDVKWFIFEFLGKVLLGVIQDLVCSQTLQKGQYNQIVL